MPIVLSDTVTIVRANGHRQRVAALVTRTGNTPTGAATAVTVASNVSVAVGDKVEYRGARGPATTGTVTVLTPDVTNRASVLTVT